jgi:hypothetical protein
MEKTTVGDVVSTFTRLALQADLDSTEEEGLINYAKDRSGIGVRSIGRNLKKARQTHNKEKADAERQRRLAERNDPRPMIEAPTPDAPWLPEMDALNEIHSASADRIPPVRNINLEATLARRIAFANLHAFSSANQEN